MADNASVIPGTSESIIGSDGTMSMAWRRFLEGLWVRSGKFQGVSVSATSNTLLTFSYRGTDGVLRTGTLVIS